MLAAMTITQSPAFGPVVGALIGAGATAILAYSTRDAPKMQGRDLGLVGLGTVLGAGVGWGIQRERQPALGPA